MHCPSLFNFPIEMRAAAKHTQPIMPMLPLFSFLEHKMEDKKGPQILESEGLRVFRALSKKEQ